MTNDNITNFISKLSIEIRKERKEKKILTKDAAKSMDLNSSTYSNLENNPKKSMSLLKFIIMANVVKIHLSSILKRVHYNENIIEEAPKTCTKYEMLDSEKLIAQIFLEIKEERKLKGMPQRVIAEKIGVDRNYYGKIENGNRKLMSLYKVIQIAEALEVPLYVLVERAEQSLLEKDKDNDIK